MVKFSKVSENSITKAIAEQFSQDFHEYLDSDVIIIGGGPSGLMAGKRLAENGIKVLIVENNNYLGGGFWIGGFLMNTVTVRDPGERILAEIGVPYKEVEAGLFIANGPHACSKLIASTCDAGVKILNMARFDDVVLRRDNMVAGVVVNWSPVYSLPRELTCVDPIAIESKFVIDASGHDAVVAQALKKRGLLEIKGYGAMWVEKSEDILVEQTGEVHPGLIVTGMAVSTVYGIPRMGPTFGAMLYSGIKAATEVLRILQPSKFKLEKEPLRKL
jgi:thiamine thiazole synthase